MKKNDKQRLFEVMGRLDKTFKPKLNERDEEFWADEKNAGDPDANKYGKYYELENGKLIPVEKYNKYEHGNWVGMYDSNGSKIGDPNLPIVNIIPKKEPTPDEAAQTKEDEIKITDASVKAGFFNSKASDTWVKAYDQGENWHGWHDYDKFLKDGAAKGLWSEKSAEKYAKDVWRIYD